MGSQPDKEKLDLPSFLVKDYEIKANYLAGHHNRMWNRFSIFVSLETALVGGGFILLKDARGDETATLVLLAVGGIILSIVWLVLSWLDMRLLRIHSWHLEKAADRVIAVVDDAPSLLEGFHHVGEVLGTMKVIKEEPPKRERRSSVLRDSGEIAKWLLLCGLPVVTLIAWAVSFFWAS